MRFGVVIALGVFVGCGPPLRLDGSFRLDEAAADVPVESPPEIPPNAPETEPAPSPELEPEPEPEPRPGLEPVPEPRPEPEPPTEPIPDWPLVVATPGDDDIRAFGFDSTGDMVAVGNTSGQVGDEAFGQGDMLVVKTTPGGEVRWTLQIGGSENDFLNDVAFAPDDAIYVAGTTFSDALNGAPTPGGGDGVLMKISPAGELEWIAHPGTDSRDLGNACAADENGVYIAGGYFGGLGTRAHSGVDDGYIQRFDTSGNLQWTRTYGTAARDSVSKLALGLDGTVILAGGVGEDYLNPGDRRAMIFQQYDPDGTMAFESTQSFDGTQSVHDFAVGPDGSIYIAAWTLEDSGGGLSLRNNGALLAKFDAQARETLWWTVFEDGLNETLPHALVLDGDSVIVAGRTRGALTPAASAGEPSGFFVELSTDGVERELQQFSTPNLQFFRDLAVSPEGEHFVSMFTRDDFAGFENQGGTDTYVLERDRL